MEKNLNQNGKERFGGDIIKQRTIFLLGAFIAGILFITGVSTISILYLAEAKEVIKTWGTVIGILFVLGALYLVYYLKENIR